MFRIAVGEHACKMAMGEGSFPRADLLIDDYLQPRHLSLGDGRLLNACSELPLREALMGIDPKDEVRIFSSMQGFLSWEAVPKLLRYFRDRGQQVTLVIMPIPETIRTHIPGCPKIELMRIT